MPNVSAPSSTLDRSPWLIGAFALALVTTVVAIWAHNRDILRDLYDHATMISAAGKVEAGLRPYTDVRSPMQTSVYYLGWLAETVFGRTYLGLTWGGLVQALGGGGLVVWMLSRQWSRGAAWCIGGAVTLGGLSQHVEFFYNPVGLVCLALVAFGLARDPRLDDPRCARTWVVWAALFVGGTNKLNFHGLAIAIAAVLLVRAWAAGTLGSRRLLRSGLVLAVAGGIAPLAFELGWTGASLSQWVAEVVTRPTERFGDATRVLDASILLRPANDYYHHIPTPFLGGVGLLIVLIAGGWTLVLAPRGRWLEQAARLALVGGGAVGSALLMVTNYETVVLTSLPFLIVAVTVVLTLPTTTNLPRPLRILLFAAAGVWMINGAYAGWHGSRVLYGLNPPPRSAYARLTDAPRPLAYFEGVRFERETLQAMHRLAATLQAMEAPDGSLRGVLFATGVEWLERAYPETHLPGAPIWYHLGTSLGPGDQPWFSSLLQGHGINRVVVHHGWESWPPDIAENLARDFRRQHIDGPFSLHLRRGAAAVVGASPARTALPDPRLFNDHTGSNLSLHRTRASAEMDLHPSHRGSLWGASTPTWWEWPHGPQHLTAEAVAVAVAPLTAPVEVIFRVLAFDAAGTERTLAEVPLQLDPDTPQRHASLDLWPYRQRLRFEVLPPADFTGIAAGWRNLRILQSDWEQLEPPPPHVTGLEPWTPPDPTVSPYPLLWYATPADHPDTDDRSRLPRTFEQWHRQPPGSTQAVVRLNLTRGTDPAGPVHVALCFYRAGRFEISLERRIDDPTTGTLTLEGWMPEPEGWVGVQVRSEESPHPPLLVTDIEWINP